jgi:hypothetical protein
MHSGLDQSFVQNTRISILTRFCADYMENRPCFLVFFLCFCRSHALFLAKPHLHRHRPKRLPHVCGVNCGRPTAYTALDLE